MEKLEQIYYEKQSMTNLENRINNILKQQKLQNIGIKKTLLGTTTYGYEINMISIGQGKKEIFIVGGTHGSEIISIDFVTQLINQIPNIDEYDPNEITLNIIPLQNPEGFDISTNTFAHIKDQELEKKSKEYYLRYRTDSLIAKAIESLNNINNITIDSLKQFINTNKSWINLSDERCMPNIKKLNTIINSLNSKTDTIKDILFKTKQLISKLDKNNIQDIFLEHFIEIFIETITNLHYNKKTDIHQITKLYQQMFENITIEHLNIRSKKMKEKIVQAYKLNPQGSQIGHDATGIFINLNANHLLSPGIEIIKTHQIKYMTGTKSNIRNYIEGPNGLPCIDVENFEYAIENKILYKLIKESYDQNRYLATFLYHGTGGMIYYMPHKQLMEKNYEQYLEYNQELLQVYNEGIIETGRQEYRPINESDTTGYGDLLARTFPGVLMIELSKMGGNPIGPYGDKTNIYNTINENISAIANIIKYFNKRIKTK